VEIAHLQSIAQSEVRQIQNIFIPRKMLELLTFGSKERTFMPSKIGAIKIGLIHLDTAQIVDLFI
jgi:hypothetical protein